MCWLLAAEAPGDVQPHPPPGLEPSGPPAVIRLTTWKEMGNARWAIGLQNKTNLIQRGKATLQAVQLHRHPVIGENPDKKK